MSAVCHSIESMSNSRKLPAMVIQRPVEILGVLQILKRLAVDLP